MASKRLLKIGLITVLLLLIPLIAMQFTEQVDWKLFDFIIGGILIFSTGLVIDYVWRKIPSKKYKFILITVVLIVFFLIWTDLAVGIFNTPISGD
jgi:hypothetical protein